MKQHKLFINDRLKVGCERWGSEISLIHGLNGVNLFPLRSKFGYLDLKNTGY